MNSSSNSKKGFFANFKLPHALTLLFGIIVLVGIFSLILQWSGATYGDAKLDDDGQVMLDSVTGKAIYDKVTGAGILDWFAAIPVGFAKSVWIIAFLLVIGGFINMVIKSKALEAIIGKVSKGFKTGWNGPDASMKKNSWFKYQWAYCVEVVKQTWVIIPLMLFFSFAGTTYGMAEESLAFYAIIVPLAVAAGFDLWTGFLIIFVGAGVGVMGSTLNPFSVLTAINSVDATKMVDGEKVASVTTGMGVAWRWIGWIVFTLFAMSFTMFYAAGVKADASSAKFSKDRFENNEMYANSAGSSAVPKLTNKRIIIAVIFLSSFLFMAFAMIGGAEWGWLDNVWPKAIEADKANGIAASGGNAFENGNASTTWFYNQTLPLYSYVDQNDDGGFDWWLGSWYFTALTAYFFIGTVVIGLIDWTGEESYIETVVDGAKDMMGVCFAIALATAIAVVLKSTGTQVYLSEKLAAVIKAVSSGEGTTIEEAGFSNVLVPTVSYLLFIPLTFIIPSTSGLAKAVFPTVGAALNEVNPSLISGAITGYAWGAGFANMFVPTYGVVVGALMLNKIQMGEFIKAIGKFLGIMFLIGLGMIILGGLLNMATGSQLL